MLDVLQGFVFAKSSNAVLVVIFLEWILAAYGIGMTFQVKHLWAKVVNGLLSVVWIACAVMNMIAFLK